MLNLQKTFMGGLLAFALGTASSLAVAEEVSEGTMIHAGNIDEMLDRTFEGKTIQSMLPERLEWQIREYGLRIELKHSEELPRDPNYDRLTEQHAGTVSFNRDTGMIENYCTGLPFPEVSEDDPDAGWKLIWNHHFGQPTGGAQDYRRFAFLLIDEDGGLERTQYWRFQRFFETGRVDPPQSCGMDAPHHRTLLFATFPRDISGLGTLTIRHNDGRLDDTWAYIPAVRRVRTLSGGAWMDPIGGTDQLQSDIEIFNAHPTWFEDYKVIGQRWVLAVAHSKEPTWDESAGSPNAQHPRVDLANAPHWNPVDQWEPRKVWVIEATPPSEHPYSRKVMYMETEYPRFYFSETYDQGGDFWKWLNFALRPYQTADGGWGLISAWGQTVDFKARHATIFQSHPDWVLGGDLSADDVSRGALQRAGRR